MSNQLTTFFTEKANVKKCMILSTLSNTELKDLFWCNDMVFISDILSNIFKQLLRKME